MYESTPGETLKSGTLDSSCSVPSTPSGDSTSTNRYTFNLAPIPPPPRKCSTGHKQEIFCGEIATNTSGSDYNYCNKLGEEYEVMN